MNILTLVPRFCLLIALLIFNSLASSAPALDQTYDIQVIPDVVYRSAHQEVAGIPEEIDLKMDVFLPIGVNGSSPLVIFIHGGNFTQGSKTSSYAVDISTRLAQEGAVVANIDYRVEKLQEIDGNGKVTQASVTPIHEDPRFFDLVQLAQQAGEKGYYEHPNGVISALEDTLYAYDFLLENQTLINIDPQRVGVWGVSAGAVTAAHFAYILDDFNIATPDIKAVTMLSGYNGISAFTGENYVQAGEASIFQFNGDKDTTTPLFPFAYNTHIQADGIVDAAHIYIAKGIGHDTQSYIYTTITSDGDSVFQDAIEFNANALYFAGQNQSSLCEVVNSALGNDCAQYPQIP